MKHGLVGLSCNVIVLSCSSTNTMHSGQHQHLHADPCLHDLTATFAPTPCSDGLASILSLGQYPCTAYSWFYRHCHCSICGGIRDRNFELQACANTWDTPGTLVAQCACSLRVVAVSCNGWCSPPGSFRVCRCRPCPPVSVHLHHSTPHLQLLCELMQTADMHWMELLELTAGHSCTSKTARQTDSINAHQARSIMHAWRDIRTSDSRCI